MVVVSAEFASELKTLRKGRGIYVPQISERVGPALREVCGVVSGDTAGELSAGPVVNRRIAPPAARSSRWVSISRRATSGVTAA